MTTTTTTLSRRTWVWSPGVYSKSTEKNKEHRKNRCNAPILYSNAAVRRAAHLTDEQQQPIRRLQCSRAERDLQLLTIPRHAGGQAKSTRVADSAHGQRQLPGAAVFGPGVVLLAVDAGALVVSHGSRGLKALI